MLSILSGGYAQDRLKLTRLKPVPPKSGADEAGATQSDAIQIRRHSS